MRKSKQVLALALAVSMCTSMVPDVNAASIRMNKKKVTMKVGQKVQLKVKGSKAKVKWSSNKKTVASVTKSGRVFAKKVGKAKISAKVGTKKLICKVIVKKNVSVIKDQIPNAFPETATMPAVTAQASSNISASQTAVVKYIYITADPIDNSQTETTSVPTAQVTETASAPATAQVTEAVSASATAQVTETASASATAQVTETESAPATPQVMETESVSVTPEVTETASVHATATVKPTATPVTIGKQITQVSDGDYTAMDSCASDGTYLYVLKHAPRKPSDEKKTKMKIFAYSVKTGKQIASKSYQISGVTEPNGITYYSGRLYIATNVDNAKTIACVKVDKENTTSPLADTISEVKLYNEKGKNESFCKPAAISYMYTEGLDKLPKFMLRDEDGTYYVMSYNEKENCLENPVKCNADSSLKGYGNLQDITYKDGSRSLNSDNGYLYVTSWGGNSTKNQNKVIRCTVNMQTKETADKGQEIIGYTLKVENVEKCVINLDAPVSQFDKFLVEAVGFVGNDMYYVTNTRTIAKPDDSSTDYIYKYDTNPTIVQPSATPTIKPSATPIITATPSAIPTSASIATYESIGQIVQADEKFTAMDACAAHGEYIYVLKHDPDNKKDIRIYVVSATNSAIVAKENYTLGNNASPNGMTYYDGALFIATNENKVTKISLADNGLLKKSQSDCKLEIELKINEINAITYMFTDHKQIPCFMLASTRAKKFYVASYNAKESKFENVLECETTANETLRSKIQDISYKDGIRSVNPNNGYLYVVSKNDNDADLSNKVVRFTIKKSENRCTMESEKEDKFYVNGTSEYGKFIVESTCFIKDELYFVTNTRTVKNPDDSSADFLYSMSLSK